MYGEMENTEKSNDEVAYFGVIFVVQGIADESQRLIELLEPDIDENEGGNLEDDEERVHVWLA